jgi:hypothetical protein
MQGLRLSWFRIEALLVCWLLVIGFSVVDTIDLTDDVLLPQSLLQQAFEPETIENGKADAVLFAGTLLGWATVAPAEYRYYAVVARSWMPVLPRDLLSPLFQRIRVYRI